ncbi:MAG: glycosyltransferase family 39 protein [Firmicutes bacterium]|nr:glycosyltransferase family 39 protein [Bacillota bacterium]
MDESFSYWVARHSLTQIVNLLHYDAHPPLFYMFLHFWILGGHSEFYLRIPFAVCGAASVIVISFLGNELLNHRIGFLAGLIWAFSSVALKGETLCRMYAPAVTFSLLATYFFWRGFKQSSLKNWTVYFVFAVLSIYTHYYTAFVLLAHWLFLITQRRWREAFWGLISIAAVYLPWFPVFFFQIANGASHLFPRYGISPLFFAGVFWTGEFFGPPAMMLMLAFLDFAGWIVGFKILSNGKRLEGFFLFLLFSIPFLIPLCITSFTSLHVFSFRYAIIFMPYFIFPVLYAFLNLPLIFQTPVFASFLFLNISFWYFFLTSPTYQRQNWRLASQEIQASLKPGDSILVEQTMSFFPLAYYLPQDLKIGWSPVQHSLTTSLNWYDIYGKKSLPLVKKVTQDSRRIWLIMCQYQQVDPHFYLYSFLRKHEHMLLSKQIVNVYSDNIYIFLFRRKGSASK